MFLRPFIHIGAFMVLFLGGTSFGSTLTGDTSEPVQSTFIPGQEVVLTFHVGGLAAETKEKLSVDIVDEHGQPVTDFAIPLQVASNHNGRVSFEKDTWTVDLNAPTNRLGFFQVFAQLTDGTELAPLARRGSYLTYAIVPDPFLRVHYPKADTFFGIMCARGAAAPLLGAAVDLFNYQSASWSHYEPDHAGQFNELVAAHSNRLGEILQPMEQVQTFTIAGRSIQWPMHYTAFVFNPPEWASVPGTRGHMTATLAPDGEKAWRDFCTSYVSAYLKAYPKVEVEDFEMSTEPVFGWGFKGTPKDLVRAHEIAFQAMHEASPKARVGGPTFTGVGNGEDWGFVDLHRKLFDAGIGKYIDVMHMHPYVGLPEECQFVEKLRAIKKIMRDSIGHEIPMAGTEGGYSYRGETRDNWLNKAWSDVRANLIMLGEGFLYNIAFYGDSGKEPNGETWGYYLNLDPERDGAPAKSSPTPAAAAYAAMTFLLEGHKTAGSIEWLGETAWGYAYENSNDIVLAVWDWSGTPRTVELPVGSDHAEVYDWMGNLVSTKSPKGVVKVTLTRDPHYIRGASASMWGRDAKRPVVMKETQIETYPGKKQDVAFTVTDVDGTGMKGRILVKANEAVGIPEMQHDIELAAGSSTQVTFAISVPVSATVGSYPIAIVLEQDGVPRAAAGCMIRVLAPAGITQVRPALTTNGAAIKVRLDAAIDTTGTLGVGINGVAGTQTHQPVDIKAGKQADYFFPMTGAELSPTKLYDVATSLLTTDGSRVELTKRMSFVSATAMTSPVVADGDLGEWTGATPVTLAAPASLRVPAGLSSGPADAAADVRFAWDTNALYLSFEVSDDSFQQNQIDWATWMEDCIQIGLNLDPEQVRAGAMSTLEAGGIRRWEEIDIALTHRGPEVYRTMTYDERFCPGGPIGKDKATLGVKRDGTKTTYELALPWTTLSADHPPAAGDCISFACTINDKDPNESDMLVLGMFDGIYGGKDISKYGWITLAE